MKKILGLVTCIIASVVLVGCGKPKIPADTIAAAYVNVDQLVDNLRDVAATFVDEISDKDKRKEAAQNLEEMVRIYKDDYRCFDFEWAILTVAADTSRALVIKCDYEGKNKGRDLLKVRLLPFVMTLKLDEFDCVDGKYAIFASDKDRLSKMVEFYKNGKGETSDAFNDLMGLGGDAVVRCQLANLETIADTLKITDRIKEFGKECDDTKLTDALLDTGNITLDLNASDDILGFVLTVEAGSKKLAKVVESAFNLAVFANRIGCDMAMSGSMRSLYESMVRSFSRTLKQQQEALASVAEQIREGVEIDRSGSTVKLIVELDTEDVAEAVVPVLCR